MNLTRFLCSLAGLSVLLGGCIAGQYVWTLTPGEGVALRMSPGSIGTANPGAREWNLVCVKPGTLREDPCTLRARLGQRGEFAVVAWPAQALVAVYGANLSSPAFRSADGTSVPVSRCIAPPARIAVCVFEGLGGRGALAVIAEDGGYLDFNAKQHEPLPGNYIAQRERYALSERLWVNLLRMDPAGGGGGGGGGAGM